jgi:ADP-heptose:LPS heptosyltransferase
VAAPLLDGHPHLARIHRLDERALFSGSPAKRLGELARLGRQLGGSYDMVLIGHRAKHWSVAFRLVARGTPAVQLTRTADHSLARLLRVGIRVDPMTLHESRALERLVRGGLARMLKRDPPDLPWAWDFSYIEPAALDLPPDFVAVHLGGGSNARTDFRLKRWPHMTELIGEILATTKLSIVLVGDRSEFDEGRAVVTALGPSSRIHDLIGCTTIRQLVDVVRRARAFVGPDSAPLHIADALGVPSVGLYGPTSPVSWGLMAPGSRALFHDVPCRPCYRDDGHFPECPYHHRCMRDLAADRVLRELEALTRFAVPPPGLPPAPAARS